MIKKTLLILFLFAVSSSLVHGQTETLTNVEVIEMSRSGLSSEIILKKLKSSTSRFDLSAKSLIEMKTAGVSDELIGFMLEFGNAQPVKEPAEIAKAPEPIKTFRPLSGAEPQRETVASPSRPRSISFEKSSLHPSRQALEKELLKRKDFQNLNLTILRYKEQADLYAEIGFVSGSVLTHRYVYRIYDRRTGAVIVAGETTSWGSLAENLARHIAKRLNTALSK
jgi:hypothetical protein